MVNEISNSAREILNTSNGNKIKNINYISFNRHKLIIDGCRNFNESHVRVCCSLQSV